MRQPSMMSLPEKESKRTMPAESYDGLDYSCTEGVLLKGFK